MTKRILSVALLLWSLAATYVNAQDLMARQAMSDRQLRAVDSVSVLRSFQQRQTEMVNSLYHSWDTETLFAYKGERLPMFYKIDLRDFTMPIKSTKITSNFGYRRSFRRNHYGLDVKLYTGDTVVSAFSGKVRVAAYDRGGYGHYVVVRHPNGLETLYGHLSKRLVEPGQIVESGEPIGLGGNTGRSTGSHLHFETRLLGEAINPALLFDFEAQDVTGDYYVYQNSKGYDLAELVDEEEYENLANAETNSRSAEPASQYYSVKKGDTLYRIARQQGITFEELLRLNGLNKRSRIIVGQILKVRE